MAIYQCIPGSGKTWLADLKPHLFVDSDRLLEHFTDSEASKSALDGILASQTTKAEFAEALGLLSNAYTVLCNFDPGVFGLKVDRRYAYRSDEYVPHLRLVRRLDLIEAFSVEELEGWARSYEAYPDTVFMRPGWFIGDSLGGSD